MSNGCSTIAEVRKWYDGGIDEEDDHHHHHHRDHGEAALATAAAAARGTVFEFYDTNGTVPPTQLSRKAREGLGGVRDYHWTAALTLRMMAEEAARAAAAAAAKTRRHNRGWSGSSGAELPDWVPAARGRTSSP